MTPLSMGAARRFMKAEPVPLDHMMGARPVVMTANLISFRRNLRVALSTMAQCP